MENKSSRQITPLNHELDEGNRWGVQITRVNFTQDLSVKAGEVSKFTHSSVKFLS